MQIEKSSIRNILIIKPRAIGDVVLSSIVIRNIRLAYPKSTIDFLTERPSTDVLRGNPDLNTVIVFDPKKQNGLELIVEISQRKYDLVIDLFGNPRTAIVTLMSGARYRVGYKFGMRKYCYNLVINPRGGNVHNTQFNLDSLIPLEIPIISRSIFFPVGENAETTSDEYFEREQLNNKFVIALNAGGGWYTKKWQLDKFAKLGDLLVEKYGVSIILLWGPGELEEAKTIASFMKHPASLIPPVGLKELAAILRRTSLMITNDSGPMHIAAAMKTPIVSIFGPTNPILQGPYDTESEIVRNEQLTCLGCNFTSCPIGNPCMTDLYVDDVLKAVERLKKRISDSVKE